MGKTENMGLGLSVVHDQIGPVTDSNVNVDYIPIQFILHITVSYHLD